MSLPNLAAMRAVADRLGGLGLDYAFLGGSIVNLLLDNPEISPARPTDDVDVVLETVTAQRYSDLEDFVTVIDGREDIVAEVNTTPASMRRYVIDSIKSLVSTEAFNEALPGHLPPDRASQQRLSGLRRKLREIAALE